MDSEVRTFGAGTILTVVGLGVMLFGVYLDDGLVFNTFMMAGGVVIAVGIGGILLGVMRVEAAHEGA